MPLLPPQEFGAAYSNAATDEYPSGSYKDETVPGSSRDGSPLVAATENDRLGFDYALAAEVGMTFTNVPDTATSSQRLEAHKKLIHQEVIIEPFNFDSVDAMIAYSNHEEGSRYCTGNSFWLVVGTAALSTGTYVSLGGSLGAIALNFLHVDDFGAAGDYLLSDRSVNPNPTDDTDVIKEVLALCESMGKHFVASNKYYMLTDSINLKTGLMMRGGGRQTYGEFDQSKASTTFKFVGVTGFCITTDQYTKTLVIEDFSFEGDYSCSGISMGFQSRELTLNRISLKYFNNGIYTNDCFVASLRDVTITAQGVGLDWGAGTTLNVDNIGIQGDPRLEGIDIGIRFRGGLANSKFSGFVQYAKTFVSYAGRNSVVLGSMDFEFADDSEGSRLIQIGDVSTGSLTLQNVTAVLGTATDDIGFFEYVGTAEGSFVLDIQTIYQNIPPQDKWFYENGGSLNHNVYIKKDMFTPYESKLSDTINDRVFQLTGVNDASQTDGLYLVGSGTYDLSMLEVLYYGTMIDKNGDYLRNGVGSLNFGNGITYKVSTAAITGGTTGQPMVSHMSCRYNASSPYGIIERSVATSTGQTVPITIDATAGTFTIAAQTEVQVFIITKG